MLTSPSSAPASVGLQACIFDMEHKCIDPIVVHSSLIICLSSDGPLRKIKEIKSLNISHRASGTIFKVILPIELLPISAGAIIDGGVLKRRQIRRDREQIAGTSYPSSSTEVEQRAASKWRGQRPRRF
jgi:hypothetical protein